MLYKKGQKKMVDSSSIKTVGKSKDNGPIVIPQNLIKPFIRANKAMVIEEEKVEVLIKEIIRIKPADFSAFKHALEEFVNSWDK